MRKVSLILAVFLLTVPAWASNVTITCTPATPDHNNVLVSYNDGEPNKVRAFALDITVTNGTITDVNDNITTWYTIHPGSIVIDSSGNVTNWGSVVADPCDLPSDTKKGIGHDGITIEMGALYSPPTDNHGPPNTGDLIRFKVTPVHADQNSVVTIVENSSRGGVVLTDPNKVSGKNFTVVSNGCTIVRYHPIVIECYPSCRTAEYNMWKSAAVNKPPCWCIKRQCHGDADNQSEYVKGKGYYYAHFKDLNLLLAAWNVREPPQGPGMAWPSPSICTDFNHGDPEYVKGKGYYRVHFKDLNILLASWNIRQPPQGSGIPEDCLKCP